MRALTWMLGVSAACLLASACGASWMTEDAPPEAEKPRRDEEEKKGGGSAGAPSPPQTSDECEPDGKEDLPDDDFADTNCDGIDGDLEKAIFVDPFGSDAGDGSIDAPVATLTKGVALARTSGKSVYVCTARYEEAIELDGPVSIYGGYDCTDGWKRKPQHAIVAPVEGRPLTITKVEEPLTIDRINFVAADARGAGQSSVAALVIDSVEVYLRHVDLEAGRGAAGRNGAAPAAFAKPDKAPDGKNSNAVAQCYVYGAAPASCLAPCSSIQICCGYTSSNCPSECRPSTVKSECKGVVSGEVKTKPPACTTDAGTVERSYANGGDGGNGYDRIQRTLGATPTVPTTAGQPGKPGAPASAGFGSISFEGEYLPTNAGTPGGWGHMGAGGKGGAGGDGWVYAGGGIAIDRRKGGAGGAGGAAGCGGRPGEAGGGGGASIALVAVRSYVEVEQALLRTAQGGAGGKPSAGGPGQEGGAPGAGGLNEKGEKTAWSGEAGTRGGPGGPGGPGGGGPSIGVVAVGIEPILEGVVFEIGAGGPGGAPLSGSGMPQGAAGLSQEVYLAR